MRDEAYKQKNTTNKKIEFLIRARYPLIYIVSSEESRIEKEIKRIVKEREKKQSAQEGIRKLFHWSITKGMEDETGAVNSELREPLKFLDFIIESDINGVFVLRDFHPYLNDPVVIRKLRDLNRSIKGHLKNILLISPILKIPMEIEKEVAVIDYELPTKEEINLIIDRVLREVNSPSEIEIFHNKEKRDKVIDAALGLTSEEIENVFARSLVESKQFDIDIILSEKEQIIRKSGVLEFYNSMEQISDVGGLENLKEWLYKRSLAFTKKARDFGLPQPKGALLIGIPGCGKSLTAKAISSLWKLPLLRLDVGKVFSSLVGSSEENVRRAIQTAESIAPSILWLDELEKGFSGMQSSGMSDAGTSARVFGTFITWLQEKTSPVFVVATANNISILPPELLRKGRFDEIFFVDLPNAVERKEIFKIHLQKRHRDPSLFDLDELSNLTKGYSGAEIEQIIISALYDAFDENDEINDQRLHHTINDIIPLSQTMKEELTKLRDWAKSRARKTSVQTEHDEDDIKRKIELD